ncbi:TolC family protein [Calothrix sp. PCC 6303]|uniref:TolC family protein n=1 Tax=Calothrix sp. PCC 6303 TaxID=1170562 RepID=UPI0002DCFDFA|nr:TolC family protein [Calothrix sp. PCC 6303]
MFAPRLLFWSIAIAFAFPGAAKGTEAKTPPQVEKTQNTSTVAKAGNLQVSGRAADLIAANPTKVVTFSAPDEVSHPQKLKQGHGHKHKRKSSSSDRNLNFPKSAEAVKIRENQALSLEQVLAIAQRQNPELQAAILGLKRSQAGLQEAKAALYPNITLNGDITKSESPGNELSVERGVAAPQSDQAVTAFNGQAKLTYNIYTSGRRQATIRQAEEQLHFDKLAVESKAEEIRQNVTLRYYDLQLGDERVRITKAAVENAEASFRDSQSLESAGVGTKFDVLRSQVNLANAQQDLTNARSQQQIARRQLAALLNLPPTLTISAADSVKVAGLWNQKLEESVVQALQNRPELQQRIVEGNISEQKRKQALSQLGPQVALVATYDVLDQYNDNASGTDGYSVGVKASWNLYDGGAARAQAKQQRLNKAIAETNFVNQSNQVRFEVEQYYTQLQSNLENVQTTGAAVEQAQEALRLSRLRFQSGIGTQTDVISAENDLTRAEGNRVTAVLDYNRAYANLQRAISLGESQ